MQTQKYVWIFVSLALIIALLLFHASGRKSEAPPGIFPNALAPANSTVSASGSVSAQIPTLAGNLASNGAAINVSLKQGTINKSQAVDKLIMQENDQPQDFYGKVIDQYNQPVAGVSVAGNIMLNGLADSDPRIKRYETQTDSEGLFQFVGIFGAKLGVTVSKEGYLMGAHGEGFLNPPGGKTSPYERALLTMWRLRGPEKLIGVSFMSTIPHDGTPANFDLVGQSANPTGDLRVTFDRSPLEVRRGKDQFNSHITIEMLQGGLLAENDSYPYWAPASGYAPSLVFDISSNTIPWIPEFSQNFYIQNSHGQYGQLTINIYSALTPVRIKFNLTLNPSGSQNLEPGPPQ